MDDLDIVFNKVTVDKILPLSKELSARFPHEVNGRKDTVNAVFSSSFPIIKKSRQSFIFLLKDLTKHFDAQARISKHKRDKDFPKSTSLRVQSFQYSNGIDHSEEINLINEIILKANVELLNVAALTVYKGFVRWSRSNKPPRANFRSRLWLVL